MEQRIGLSIVLPCYNPPIGWGDTVLDSIQSVNHTLGIRVELIIVNDGSSVPVDEVLQHIKSNYDNTQCISYDKNRGKGYALRQGVTVASQPFTIYTDIDFPYDIDSVVRIYHYLCQSYDVVVGTKGAAYYQHTPYIRKVISKVLRRVISISLRMPITDTQAGLKGFNAKGKAVFLSTSIDRYLFDLEFVYLSFRHQPKLKIIASPSDLRDGVVFRKMNLGILKDEAINFLKILWK